MDSRKRTLKRDDADLKQTSEVITVSEGIESLFSLEELEKRLELQEIPLGSETQILEAGCYEVCSALQCWCVGEPADCIGGYCSWYCMTVGGCPEVCRLPYCDPLCHVP